VPIVISGIGSKNAVFDERTSTLIVNAHGAADSIARASAGGTETTHEACSDNEEMSCTVVDINPGNTAIPEVGVEFSEPCPHFWRVSFPPADWTPRSPEAHRKMAAPAQAAPLTKK